MTKKILRVTILYVYTLSIWLFYLTLFFVVKSYRKIIIVIYRLEKRKPQKLIKYKKSILVT